MREIQVHFENGDFLITSINGTNEEILKYYIGQSFNMGTGGNDLMTKAVKVDFLD